MGDLVVPGLHVLGPPVMLTEQEAMVGADNEQGVLPEREFIHRIEHLALHISCSDGFGQFE